MLVVISLQQQTLLHHKLNAQMALTHLFQPAHMHTCYSQGKNGQFESLNSTQKKNYYKR